MFSYKIVPRFFDFWKSLLFIFLPKSIHCLALQTWNLSRASLATPVENIIGPWWNCREFKQESTLSVYLSRKLHKADNWFKIGEQDILHYQFLEKKKLRVFPVFMIKSWEFYWSTTFDKFHFCCLIHSQTNSCCWDLNNVTDWCGWLLSDTL